MCLLLLPLEDPLQQPDVPGKYISIFGIIIYSYTNSIFGIIIYSYTNGILSTIVYQCNDQFINANRESPDEIPREKILEGTNHWELGVRK